MPEKGKKEETLQILQISIVRQNRVTAVRFGSRRFRLTFVSAGSGSGGSGGSGGPCQAVQRFRRFRSNILTVRKNIVSKNQIVVPLENVFFEVSKDLGLICDSK